jgi:hypothetical protein
MDGDDGQHRAWGTGHPGGMTGQTSKGVPGAFVGNKCGAAENMKVGKTECDADISTTSMSGGDGPNLKHRGEYRSDDKR